MKKRRERNRRKTRDWKKGQAKMMKQIEKAHKDGRKTKGTRRFFGDTP